MNARRPVYIYRIALTPNHAEAERLRSLAGPAARNAMSRKTVMPARSSATSWFAVGSDSDPAFALADMALPRAIATGARSGIRITFSFAITVAGAVARGTCIANSMEGDTEPILERSEVLGNPLPKLLLINRPIRIEEAFAIGC